MNLALVTPVHLRHELTAICLRQRAQMIETLRAAGLDATAIVVGDDERHRRVAEAWGFEWVEMDNTYVGRKFNAGYERARDLGYSHAMAIGSDSWLHPDVILNAEFHDKKVTSLVGLSAFRPDGLERLDMFVKYAAGFGVGMIYPVSALFQDMYPDGPCEPTKMKGCDSSVWRRCGNGKLGVDFQAHVRLSYLNFGSADVQITTYESLHFHRRTTLVIRDVGRVFGDLREMYEYSVVDDVEGHYAARSIGAFLTGETKDEGRLRRREERRKRSEATRRRYAQPRRWPNAAGPQGARR